MRFAARVFFRCVSFILILALLFPIFSYAASAQTVTPVSSADPRDYAIPNAEANVPHNQHTLIQSVLIEMFLAVGCQLTGVDMASPQTPCLVINPKTNKLSYGPSSSQQNGQLQIGGLLGALDNGIAMMYTPTISTKDYVDYLAGNFGLTKKAYALQTTGFEGLAPIRSMWVATRDVSYFLLILAFIFIGIGVMLRIKIDPRTVMTIQNQIPRVIIAIILITFSYAIAAVMIDLMWASTYVVINVITRAANPSINCAGHLSNYATDNLVSTPFSYANKVFVVNACDKVQNGFFDLSKGVANAITEMQMDAFLSFFGINPDSCSGGVLAFLRNPGQCIFGAFIMWITSFIWALIIFIILIITFFRIWLELLKAYAMLILYTILSPLFIVVNLLPKRPLGFERWIRVFFANLAIFPATVAMIVLSSIFVTTFTNKHDTAFVPPLIGNTYMSNFGVIIGFAVLLLTPQLISLIREKLGVPPVKQTAAIGAAFSSGASAVGAPISKGWKHLNRKHPTTGQPVGILAVKKGEYARKAMRAIPGIGGKWAAQQEHIEKHGTRATKEDLKGADQRSLYEQRRDRKAGTSDSDYEMRQKIKIQEDRIKQENEQRAKLNLPPLDRGGGGGGNANSQSVDVRIDIKTDGGGHHSLVGKSDQPISAVIQAKLKNDAKMSDAEIAPIMSDLGAQSWGKKNMGEVESGDHENIDNFLRTKGIDQHFKSSGNTPPPTGTS